MNINWRAGGMAALGAAILTVLVAGIAGRGMATILWRALVSAGVTGAAVAGLQILIGRFLPELTEIGANSGSDTATGRSVNLVVGDDDEEEQITPPSTILSLDDDSDVDDAEGTDAEVTDAEGNDGEYNNGTAPAAGSESHSVAESGEMPAGTRASSNSDAEEIEESRRAATGPDDDDDEEFEELVDDGKLPEIGGLESSFRDISLDGESATSERRSGSDKGNALTQGQDPAEIARALQTMMKKE